MSTVGHTTTERLVRDEDDEPAGEVWKRTRTMRDGLQTYYRAVVHTQDDTKLLSTHDSLDEAVDEIEKYWGMV